MQEDLELVKALVRDVDRAEDARAIIEQAAGFRGIAYHCLRMFERGHGAASGEQWSFRVLHNTMLLFIAGSGVPDFEQLVHGSRGEHVQLFFGIRETAKAERETEQKIAALQTSLERLVSYICVLIDDCSIILLSCE